MAIQNSTSIQSTDEDNDCEFEEVLTEPQLRTRRNLNDLVWDLNSK